MNSIVISGNLGKDPEVKTVNDKKLVTFSVADKINQDLTNWHSCECWDKTAENIEKYFKKGDKIIIVGTVLYQNYEKDGINKTATKIRVNQFDFGGGNKNNDNNDKKENNAYDMVKNNTDIKTKNQNEIPF